MTKTITIYKYGWEVYISLIMLAGFIYAWYWSIKESDVILTFIVTFGIFMVQWFIKISIRVYEVKAKEVK